MAEVNHAAVMSGILHGVSVSVAGGLILDGEAQTGGYLDLAQGQSAQIIEAHDGQLAPWQQIMIGEIVGTYVAARIFAGTFADAQVLMASASDIFRRLWDLIDRF